MSTQAKPSFLQALLASGLLDDEQQKELRSLPEAKEDNPNNLAKAVLQRGWMTRYQLAQIANGKAKGLTLGQYTIIERLGEGGMGQVLKAKHRRMNRVVALKIIRKDKLADEISVQRFYKEVEAAAQLHHPNIVVAYDADEVNDTHYMAMEYVEGCDLSQLVSEGGPLSERQACDFIRQAALGLQHAHERGMVHRDIKPHNLLVTQAKDDDKKGDEDPEAVVKILDMGLAKIQTGDGREQGLTQTGAVIGTPDYLAPEQAVDSKSADIRSDLYALGCTFYFALTGRPPFHADSMAEVLLKHQMEDVPTPKKARPDLSDAVVSVIQKLLAKKPEDRYQTPAELLEVLDPLCKGEKPAMPVALAMPVAKAPDSPSMDGFWDDTQDGVTEKPKRKKSESRTRADSRTDIRKPNRGKRGRKGRPSDEGSPNKKWILIGASVGGALLLLVVGLVLMFTLGGEPSKDEGETVTDDTGAPRVDPRPRVAVPTGSELRLFAGHSKPVTAVAFSKDSTKAATVSEDGTIRIWNTGTGEQINRIDNVGTPVRHLAFSDDGTSVVASTASRKIHEWDIATAKGKARSSPTELDFVSNTAQSHAGVISGAQAGNPLRFAVENLISKTRQIYLLPDVTMPVVIAASSKDTRVGVLGENGHLNYYPITQPGTGNKRIVNGEECVGLACSPSGRHFAVGTKSGNVLLYDVDKDQIRKVSQGGQAGTVRGLAFTPDGLRLLYGVGKTLVATDVYGQGTVKWWSDHTADITDVTVSPNGKYALSASEDKTAKLYDLAPLPAPTSEPRVVVVNPPMHRSNPGEAAKLRGTPLDIGPAYPRGVAFASDGKQFASLHRNQKIRFWDAKTQAKGDMISLAIPTESARRMTSSADGKRFFVMQNRKVTPIDAERGVPEGNPLGGYWASPDGQYVVDFGGGKFTVRTLDNQVYTVLDGGRRVIQGKIAFSGDSSLLAFSHEQGVKIYDLKRKQMAHEMTAPGLANALAMSPDGKVLMVGFSSNNRFRFWDVEKNQPLHHVAEHSGDRQWVEFSPDGKTALSGDATRNTNPTVKYWDVATGRLLAELEGHTRSIIQIAFAPDGRSAVSCSEMELLHWDLARINTTLADAAGQASGPIRTFDHPFGRYVRYLDGGKKFISGGGELKYWDLASGRVERQFRGEQPGNRTVVLPGEKQILYVNPMNVEVLLADLQTGRTLRRYSDNPTYTHHLKLAPDGKEFATAGGPTPDNKQEVAIRTWDVESGKLLAKYVPNFRPLYIGYSPDGGNLIAVGREGVVAWDRTTQKESYQRTLPSSPRISPVAISPDGTHILFRDERAFRLELQELRTGKVLKEFSLPQLSSTNKGMFLPGGKKFLIVGQQREMGAPRGTRPTATLWLFDVSQPEPVRKFEATTEMFFGVDVSPDGRYALTASQDVARLWDLENTTPSTTNPPTPVPMPPVPPVTVAKEAKELHKFLGHDKEVLRVAFSKTGRLALSLGADKTLRVVDVQKRKSLSSLTTSSYSSTYGAAFSPNESFVASGSYSQVTVWKGILGQKVGQIRLRLPNFRLQGLAYSPDGRNLAVHGPQGPFYLVRMADSRILAEFKGHTDETRCVAFSPDGSQIASGSEDHTIRIWDVRRATTLKELKGHSGDVTGVAFSFDGKKVFSWSDRDRSLRVWDLAEGKEDHILSLSGYVRTAAFSGDGRYALIATGGNDAEFWDVHNNRRLGLLKGHTGYVRSVDITADGKLGLTGGDLTMRLWELPVEEPKK